MKLSEKSFCKMKYSYSVSDFPYGFCLQSPVGTDDSEGNQISYFFLYSLR